MAKKSKKTKITETLVNQLQEIQQPLEEKPAKKVEKKVEVKKHHHKPVPQESKLFNKVTKSKADSETDGINFGLSGIL